MKQKVTYCFQNLFCECCEGTGNVHVSPSTGLHEGNTVLLGQLQELHATFSNQLPTYIVLLQITRGVQQSTHTICILFCTTLDTGCAYERADTTGTTTNIFTIYKPQIIIAPSGKTRIWCYSVFFTHINSNLL